MYNNNESESGINEQIQQRGMLERDNELARVYENSQQEKVKKYTRAEFEQWKQSIKSIDEKNLTNNAREIITKVYYLPTRN